MILNWNDFECYREASLRYHIDKKDATTYRNALNYLEHMRKYFGKFGFPEQTEKYKNGKLKPWSAKQKQKQKDDIREWIGANK